MSIVRLALGSIALLLVACSNSDPVQPSDPKPDAAAQATWQTVIQPTGGALLSIWGTSEKDIWTVGGPLGNTGFEALVVRFDGTTWKRIPVGGTETFWWVHGSSANDVWLVGEKGRVTHWDGAKFEERTSGTTATLFGVYAFAPNDAWAVGGLPDQPDAPRDSNVVLHWDGAEWRPETLPSITKGAFFKVWGTRTDDLYVVGENAVVWHRVGTSWKREAEGLGQGRLTTVTGCSANEIYVVGGRDLLTSDGQTFTRSDEVLVQLVNDVNGVACAPASAPARPWGNVVVVGGGSLKLRRASGVWESDFGSEPYADLHGAWVDPSGAFWAVGGDFNTASRPGSARAGVVARLGDGAVPSTFVP